MGGRKCLLGWSFFFAYFSNCPLFRYDITGLTLDRASESCDGIEGSIETLERIIRSEIDLGILPSRIILAGFSQGGALSLFAGLQFPPEITLGGLVVMSGYLPARSKFKLSASGRDVPVLHCHGTADPVVQFSWGELTQQYLLAQVHAS
jgi:predicted esterase